MNRNYSIVAFGVAVLFGFNSAQAALIGHWKLDEGRGATVAVDSASGNNATYVANPDTNSPGYDPTPLWQSGVIGGAAGLDDEDDDVQEYFVIPSIPQMVGSQQLTISVWFNQNNGVNDNNGNNGLIRTSNLRISTRGNNRTAGMNTEGTTSGSPHIDARISSGEGQADGGSFNFDEGWHHALMAWDGTDDSEGAGTGLTRLYFDGQFVDTGSHTDLAATITDSGEWYIGNDICCSSRGWTGALDDVAMWNEALTADEASHIYYGGLRRGLDAPTARAAMIPEPTSLCLLSLLVGGLWAAGRWPRAL